MSVTALAQPDLKNPDLYVHAVPHELFAQLRREEGVYWNPESDGPGFWAVLRYADIVEVSRQPALFPRPMRWAGIASSTKTRWA
jgi:linalool 8-monooxygenase